MEDIFDQVEKTYKIGDGLVLLILEGGHKRKSKKKDLYFSKIGNSGLTLTWVTSPTVSTPLNPSSSLYFEDIKKLVRRDKKNNYKLILLKDVKAFKNNNHNIQSLVEPVKKETWWGRIKVWFSRKFWIPIGK
jgi:hypothetical protein